MPPYGSYGSPSIRKMENGYGHSGRTSFSLGRIFGDPFALATISIGSVSFRMFGLRREAGSLPLTTNNSLPGSSHS